MEWPEKMGSYSELSQISKLLEQAWDSYQEEGYKPSMDQPIRTLVLVLVGKALITGMQMFWQLANDLGRRR
jgi:hypothetical protein